MRFAGWSMELAAPSMLLKSTRMIPLAGMVFPFSDLRIDAVDDGLRLGHDGALVLRALFFTGHVVVVCSRQGKCHPAEHLIQSRLPVGVLGLEVLEGRAGGALELRGHGLEVADELAKLVEDLILHVVHVLGVSADDICFAKLEAVPCAHFRLLLVCGQMCCARLGHST